MLTHPQILKQPIYGRPFPAITVAFTNKIVKQYQHLDILPYDYDQKISGECSILQLWLFSSPGCSTDGMQYTIFLPGIKHKHEGMKRALLEGLDMSDNTLPLALQQPVTCEP